MNRCLPLRLFRDKKAVPAFLSLVDDNELSTAIGSSNLRISGRVRRTRQFQLGRLAGQIALKAMAPDEAGSAWIGRGVFGQPVVQGISSKAALSISHSGGYACALAFEDGHPMGVDLEKVAAENIGPILDTATLAERELLKRAGLPECHAAFILWTAKESLAKALRTGLTIPLEIYEIGAIAIQRGTAVVTFKIFNQYKCYSFSIGEFQCAIAMPRRTEWRDEIVVWCDGLIQLPKSGVRTPQAGPNGQPECL